MSLFGRKKAPLSADAPLADHLDAIGAGRDGAVAAYVRALAGRQLWAASAELPPGVEPGTTTTLGSATEVALLSSTLPDGSGSALLVFTDPAGVAARAPAAYPIGMPGHSLLDLAVRSYDGVVVDPHGRWQALASAWISGALA
jgi:hypothetical protein